MMLANVVDIFVVIIVVLLVLSILFFCYVFPKLKNRRIKQDNEEHSNCCNCKRH